MSQTRPRLGYLLPVYERRSAEHFAHIPRLLAALGQEVEVEVAIWDCRDEPELPGVAAVWPVTGATTTMERFLAMRKLIAGRVEAGCTRWFVRSAPLHALAAIWGGAETALWICGVARPPAGLRDWLQHRFASYVYRRARWIATAPGLAEYNQQMLGIPVAKQLLLNNDINLAVYQPLAAAARQSVRAHWHVPDDRLLLLYVHRLSTERGAHYLIPVIEACRAAGQPVTVLAVGGDSDQSSRLSAYAADHPDELLLAGALPNTDLPPLYGAADLFLMPSRGEGFPRVVLEAMACGTALVSTDVGCVSSVLPPESLVECLVPADDIPAFTAAVTALLAAPERRAELGRLFLQRAQVYSTEAVARQYREVLCGAE